jgi:leucyl-tRNA synthetase
MYMGPLEAQKPWNTRDIVGMSRFLNAVWRNLIGEDRDGESPATGSSRIGGTDVPDALHRQLHRAIKKVAEDIEQLRFNTAIAELIKVNNELTHLPSVPHWFAEQFVLICAPFTPHLAEEIWHRLGHEESLARHPWPAYDPAKLVESTLELPVQVNGKLRGRITVPADADEGTILSTAKSATDVRAWVEGKTVVKQLYVPKKLVNFVVK